MSSEITRMFANAATANKAVQDLHEEGYDDVFMVAPPAAADTPLSAVAAQIAQGRVLLADARIYARGVAAGHALVTVHAPFGTGKVAEHVLDSHGPIDSGMPKASPDRMWDEAAPLSSTLVMPVLIDDPDPASRAIGIPALTSGNCGLSEAIGMPLLIDGAMGDRGKLGIPFLSDNPTPLSSMLGLPVLSKRQ